MPHERFDPTDPTVWSYTKNIRDLHGENYRGRHIIGRDSRIAGGVYTGTYGGEAIVVDTDKYPEEYQELIDKVIERSREVKEEGRFRKKKVLGDVDKHKIFDAVFDTVKEALPYSSEKVEQFNKNLARDMHRKELPDGLKVPLNGYIMAKAGECRHQALLCGLLLETMVDRGYLRGKVSVDRNMQWNPMGERGGHAWARYTNSGGEVFILDVAQDFIGTLEESQQRESGWNYLRPEEKEQKAAQDAGRLITQKIDDTLLPQPPAPEAVRVAARPVATV